MSPEDPLLAAGKQQDIAMTAVTRTRGFRTAALLAMATVSAFTFAACNAKVRPAGVLPREHLPPPPSERNSGIKPKQGELSEAPVYQQSTTTPQRGLAVPSR